MAETLPSPIGCCEPCVPSGTSGPPGERGPAGADGAAGEDGISPFTASVFGTEEMPAEGDTVDVTVDSDTSWAVAGEPVYVQFWGTMIVTAVTSDPKVLSLQNPENTSTGAYDGNAPPGTVLPAGSKITPSGFQGPAGVVDGSLYLLKANNLNDVANVATARTNLGLGTAALFNQGVANGEIPNIHDAGGIGLNEFVVGTGIGISGISVNAARTALGLGTAAQLDTGIGDGQIAPNDGALTPGDLLAATASGQETLTASEVRSLLGVGNDMLLFRHQQASGDGGDCNTGSRQTVPLNTEVVDTGGHGSISGGTILLAAGTYRYNFGVVCCGVNHFQGYLWDTDSNVIIENTDTSDSYGQLAFADAGATTANATGTGQGRFTLSVDTHIQLSVSCETSQSGRGFGDYVNLGLGLVVYSWLELEKE